MVARRRTKVLLGVACAATVAYLAAPYVIERRLRARLVELGFADARFDVTSIGLDHVRLANVHLADGLDLGTVEIDPSIELLWSTPERVTVREARVSTESLRRARATLAASGRIDAPAGRTVLDIDITVRDPGSADWNVHGRGTIVVGRDVMLEDAHVDASVAHASQSPVEITNATLAADVSGSLSTLGLEAHGELRADRVQAGPLELTHTVVPFTLSAGGISLGAATASLFGGEITSEPIVYGSAPSVTLHARGLRLAELVREVPRMRAQGALDGELVLGLTDGVVTPLHGRVFARSPGTLEVGDAAWRERITRTQSQSPLALHARIADALSSFRYESLDLELAAPGAATELRLATRGRGLHNDQDIEVVVNVNGVRDAAARWSGGLE